MDNKDSKCFNTERISIRVRLSTGCLKRVPSQKVGHNARREEEGLEKRILVETTLETRTRDI